MTPGLLGALVQSESCGKRPERREETSCSGLRRVLPPATNLCHQESPNGTFLGNTVLTDGIVRLSIGNHAGFRMGPQSDDGCPRKKKEQHIETQRRPRDDPGREYRDAPTSEGMPRTAAKHHILEVAGRLWPTSSEELGPADTLMLDFQPPDPEEMHGSCLETSQPWSLVVGTTGNSYKPSR